MTNKPVYSISAKECDHQCCYDVAIIRDKTQAEENCAILKNRPMVICDCDKDAAVHILKALEKYTQETGILV